MHNWWTKAVFFCKGEETVMLSYCCHSSNCVLLESKLIIERYDTGKINYCIESDCNEELESKPAGCAVFLGERGLYLKLGDLSAADRC